jgi:WhiB family redox-sensing transcriptional regulator
MNHTTEEGIVTGGPVAGTDKTGAGPREADGWRRPEAVDRPDRVNRRIAGLGQPPPGHRGPGGGPCESCRLRPATTTVLAHDAAAFRVCGDCAPDDTAAARGVDRPESPPGRPVRACVGTGAGDAMAVTHPPAPGRRPDVGARCGPDPASATGRDPIVPPRLGGRGADIAAPGPGWRSRALCAQTDPELFFPAEGASIRDAKKVCSRCLVRAECLMHALDEGEWDGVWGGLSDQERRRLTRPNHRAAHRPLPRDGGARPQEGEDQMPATTPDMPPTDRLTLLRLLAAGRPLAVAAAAVGLDQPQAAGVARDHGYPDRERLAREADQLTADIDRHHGRPTGTGGERRRPAGRRTAPPGPRDQGAGSRVTHPVTGSARRPTSAGSKHRGRPTGPARAGRPFDATAALLLQGRESDRRSTRALAARIGDQLTDLRDRLTEEDRVRREREQARAEREAERAEALAEVARLEQQLREARARARGARPNPVKQSRVQAIQTGTPDPSPRAAATRERLRYHREFMDRHLTTAAEVRQWCATHNVACSPRALIPRAALDAYDRAHPAHGAA